MKQKKEVEIKGIFLAVTLLFLGFLIVPLCRLFYKSLEKGGALTLSNYLEVLPEGDSQRRSATAFRYRYAVRSFRRCWHFCLHTPFITAICPPSIKA